MNFKVTIVRTITTDFEIDAASVNEARKKVKAYGISEAAQDYADQNTADYSRIKSIKPTDVK